MTFDIQLAIAALQPNAYMPAPFNPLRERYPELSFVFDDLDDLRETVESMEDTHAEEMREIETDKEMLERNISDAREELERVIDEISLTIDEDDEEIREKYTVEALLVDLECTRDQIREALLYVAGV